MSLVFQQTPGAVPFSCGGLLRPWARGAGVVAGETRIDGVLSPCRVYLYDITGTLRGFRLTGADGLYQFIGLPGGEYRLVILDDSRTERRGLVEHIVVSE